MLSLNTTSILVITCGIASAQFSNNQTLGNQDIAKMVQAGIPDGVIVTTINASQPAFNFDAGSLEALARAGVKNDIIRAMAGSQSGRPVELAFGNSATAPQGRSNAPQSAVGVQAIPAACCGTKVFIEDSPNAWSHNSGLYGWFGPGFQGGSHPQTVEIMKTFGQSCQRLSVTRDRATADYFVVLEREAQKVFRRDNKMVVFNRAGDMVYFASKRELGNAVRGFCDSVHR